MSCQANYSLSLHLPYNLFISKTSKMFSGLIQNPMSYPTSPPPTPNKNTKIKKCCFSLLPKSTLAYEY